MSYFVADDRLTIQPFRRSDGVMVWVTSSEIRFRFGDSNGPIFAVPMGFETDLGSIPAALRWLFNPADPQCVRSYVLHDWVNSLTRRRPPGPGVWSSQAAAAVLYDALRCDGVSTAKAKTLYLGVVSGIARNEW